MEAAFDYGASKSRQEEGVEVSKLEQWMAEQQEEEESRPSLEDALLRRNFGPYAVQRLRFPIIRFVTNTILHVFELVVLAQLFFSNRLSLVLVISAACSLIVAGWWGALETFREELRDAHRDRQSQLVKQLLNQWLPIGPVFAAYFSAGLLLTVLLLVYGLPGEQGSAIHLAVAAAYIFRVAVSTVVQTIHSAVYSVRRVYRPVVAVFAVDILVFAGVLAGSTKLGAWNFPLLHVAGTILQAAISLHYLRRMFELLDWKWPSVRLRIDAPLPVIRRQAAFAAVSSMMMGLDALIVLLMFFRAGGHPQNHHLLVFLYLLAPALRMSHDWVRIFYIDFHQVDLALFPNLRRWFELRLRNLSCFMGVLCCLVGVAVIEFCFGTVYLRTGALLLVVFLSRAALGYFQFRQFTAGDYATAVISGAIVLFGAAAMSQLGLGVSEALSLFSIFLFAAAVVAFIMSQFGRGARQVDGALAPFEWLEKIASIRAEVTISLLEFSIDISPLEHRRAADALAVFADVPRFSTTMLDRFVLLAEISGTKLLRREDVLAAFPISFRTMQSLGTAHDGVLALKLIGSSRVFPAPADELPSEAELAAAFRGYCPSGTVLSITEGLPAEVGFSRGQLRRIYTEAARFARRLGYGNKPADFTVSAQCDGGGLRQIFVGSEKRKNVDAGLEAWAEQLRSIALAAALAPAEREKCEA